jgi:hypothetical protein
MPASCHGVQDAGYPCRDHRQPLSYDNGLVRS